MRSTILTFLYRIGAFWRRFNAPLDRRGRRRQKAESTSASQVDKAREAWKAHLRKHAPHIFQQWHLLPEQEARRAKLTSPSRLSVSHLAHPGREQKPQNPPSPGRFQSLAPDEPKSGEPQRLYSEPQIAVPEFQRHQSAEVAGTEHSKPAAAPESPRKPIKPTDTKADPVARVEGQPNEPKASSPPQGATISEQKTPCDDRRASPRYRLPSGSEQSVPAAGYESGHQRQVSPEQWSLEVRWAEQKKHPSSLDPEVPEPRNWPELLQTNPAPASTRHPKTALTHPRLESADPWPSLLPYSPADVDRRYPWLEAQYQQRLAQEQRGL